jgi:hypothetical protein
MTARTATKGCRLEGRDGRCGASLYRDCKYPRECKHVPFKDRAALLELRPDFWREDIDGAKP